MTEETHLEINEDVEMDSDVKDILESLSPQIEITPEGKKKIFFNLDGVNQKVKELKSAHEVLFLESDLLGLRCSMQSKTKSISELQKMGHESLLFMMKNIPSKVPLGVG